MFQPLLFSVYPLVRHVQQEVSMPQCPHPRHVQRVPQERIQMLLQLRNRVSNVQKTPTPWHGAALWVIANAWQDSLAQTAVNARDAKTEQSNC